MRRWDFGTCSFRNQRIGRLLDPVVDELVGAVQALDQSRRTASQSAACDVLLRVPENDRKHRDPGGIAQAGQLLQGRLRFGRQAASLPTMRSTTLSV